MDFVRDSASRSPCCTRARCWPKARSTTFQNRPARHRSLSGALTHADASRTSISTTAPARRLRASRSRPRRARSPACSAATASARPACCAPSSARSGRPPAGSSGRARTSPGCAATSAPGAASRIVPQGREIFPLLTVEENLQTGFAPLPRRGAQHPGRHLRAVPGPQDHAAAARRRPLRRPAAAARDRPRAGDAAAAAGARRADRRHPALDHQGHRPRARAAAARRARSRSCWSSSISTSPASSPTVSPSWTAARSCSPAGPTSSTTRMFAATSPSDARRARRSRAPCPRAAAADGRVSTRPRAPQRQDAPWRASSSRRAAARLPAAPRCGELAVAALANAGGGLVGGDRSAIDIRLGDGAAALVTTQAAEKVYRSLGADCRCRYPAARSATAPGSNGCPQETILFDRARLRRVARACPSPGRPRHARREPGASAASPRASGPSAGCSHDRYRHPRRRYASSGVDVFRLEGDFAPVLSAGAALGGARAVATFAYAATDAADAARHRPRPPADDRRPSRRHASSTAFWSRDCSPATRLRCAERSRSSGPASAPPWRACRRSCRGSGMSEETRCS